MYKSSLRHIHDPVLLPSKVEVYKFVRRSTFASMAWSSPSPFSPYARKRRTHAVTYYLFMNKMFLHCFFQRHISALAMSHLQVDHFFLCKGNHTISNANCMIIVWYFNCKGNHTISDANCMVIVIVWYCNCKGNYTISDANCMVSLAKKKVINLKMAHN